MAEASTVHERKPGDTPGRVLATIRGKKGTAEIETDRDGFAVYVISAGEAGEESRDIWTRFPRLESAVQYVLLFFCDIHLPTLDLPARKYLAMKLAAEQTP